MKISIERVSISFEQSRDHLDELLLARLLVPIHLPVVDARKEVIMDLDQLLQSLPISFDPHEGHAVLDEGYELRVIDLRERAVLIVVGDIERVLPRAPTRLLAERAF